MAMKYAVIGAGGMGIQYGVLLQEFAHKDVDFIDHLEDRTVEKIREQGAPMSPKMATTDTSYRSMSTIRRNTPVSRTCGLCS